MRKTPLTTLHAIWVPLAWLALSHPAAAQPESQPTTAASEDVEITTAVVWSADAAGEWHSHWLRATDEGVEEVAVRPGIVLASSDALWAWRPGSSLVELCACDLETGECTGRRGERVPTAKLEALGGDARIDLSASVRSAVEEYHETFDYGITPVAALGRYLLVQESAWEYWCGAAHGSGGSSQTVYDLDRAESRSLLSPEEQAAAQARWGTAVVEEMRRRGLDIFGETARLTAVWPSYDSEGWLDLEYQFTADTSYAASDDWASYTVSERVDAETLPVSLQAFDPLPDVVQAWRHAHPELQMVGWTAASDVDDVRQRQLDSFLGLGTAAPSTP